MNVFLVIVGVAGMFLLLIAPHEAGHFALAKLFKVNPAKILGLTPPPGV